MEAIINVMFIYNSRPQEILDLPYNLEAMDNVFTLFDYLTNDFSDEERNDLVKISCCVYGEVPIPEWYMKNNGKIWFNLDANHKPLGGLHRDHYIENMKLDIDGESVNIYVDKGLDAEPIHVCYWHLEEVEENADVALSIANAVHLFHTDKNELLNKLDLVG